MKIDQLISPLDNRYSDEILELSEIFSESNLNKTRFIIELEWLIFICSSFGISSISEIMMISFGSAFLIPLLR